jgi:midasin (ATPase involved in ribosome maturation)
VEIEIPNTKERMEALKQASDLNDYYNKLLSEVKKDGRRKKSATRIFEDKNEVAKIHLNEEFPTSNT